MTLPVARDLAQQQDPGQHDRARRCSTPRCSALPEEAIRRRSARRCRTPRRLGEPDEYAALASHIVANPMLNGETIRLDGAIRMAPR